MKLSTTKLLGLLALLVAIYFGVEYFGGKSKSKSLRSVLVNIDTTLVTKLEVIGKGSQAMVNKVNGTWQVSLDNGQVVPADANAVMNALNALNGIKPARMATRKKEKWAEYQVDSVGTEVKVYTGTEKSTEIILGKLGVSGQRSYHTFVRLAGDDEVYVADNFMAFSVPSETSAYRNNTVTKINKDSLASIEFTYPTDTSFRLEKIGDSWMANGNPTDSTKVEKFVRGLGNISSRNFMNTSNELEEPIYRAKYSLKNGEEVSLHAFEHLQGLVLKSSANPTSYFADSAAFNKAFIGYNGIQ